jgi:histidinol-phosphatase (PHP family)
MSEMCRAALNLNIPEIGFSEHFDLHPLDPCKDFFKPEAWWQELTRCREEFDGLLTIKAGIEISEPHRHSQEVHALLEKYGWDYTLGSLHWVGDDLIFDHESFALPENQVYENYFVELQKMVERGNFDILGHMDMVKRYGYEHFGAFDPQNYETHIRSILQTLCSKNIALEVNTGPLRRSIKEPSPSLQILEWFREEGGEWITLGSDAHAVRDVGAGLEKVVEALSEVGFRVLASFSGRKIKPTSL